MGYKDTLAYHLKGNELFPDPKHCAYCRRKALYRAKPLNGHGVVGACRTHKNLLIPLWTPYVNRTLSAHDAIERQRNGLMFQEPAYSYRK